VRDDGRRERVATLLKDYGRRVQYSVFVADFGDEDDGTLAAEMRARLARQIREEDRAHVFVLCRGCVGRTVTMGSAEDPVDEEFYVV